MMTEDRLEELRDLATMGLDDSIAGCELREAVKEIDRVRSECQVYHLPCKTHGYIHGYEAEQLRSGIEQLVTHHSEDGEELARCCTYVDVDHLTALVEQVGANDSCGYLEAKHKAKELKEQREFFEEGG